MVISSLLKKFLKRIIPHQLLVCFRYLTFDDSIVIYKGISYKEYLEESLKTSRPEIYGINKLKLKIDILDTYLTDKTRPDEYLLYNYDLKSRSERARYMPQVLKDNILIDYYKDSWEARIGQLKNKFGFFLDLRPFFKREAICLLSVQDFEAFDSFCKKHNRFMVKLLEGNCGVGVMIIDLKTDLRSSRDLFDELIWQGKWIVEELIIQNETISEFNDSSINTIRFPSFRHGNQIVQAYPCMRFGRKGSIVDNAGQGGVFVSVDINSGEIITNGFDELGYEYERHPDSGKMFKGFKIPLWGELLNEAHQAHMALSEEQTYVAFDYALSDKGWMIVEGNWGDFVLQQTSLKRGLKNEFVQLLTGHC